MQVSTISDHTGLADWMQAQDIELWGTADLSEFSTPKNVNGKRYPFALSWAISMNPQIMASINQGPNQAYADEYAEVN